MRGAPTSMVRRRVITLSTDFGSVYSAQVKAVLHRRAPTATVVELTSDLPAHRVSEAAFLLGHIASGFPPRTVHLAVVDPGVGGRRAPIAVLLGDGSVAIGPDNGLLESLANRLGIRDVRRIEPRRLPGGGPISPTFEGRDLFAPAAALVASGRSVATLGRRTHLTRGVGFTLRRGRDAAEGEVVHVDRFGDLITNVPGSWIPRSTGSVEVRFARRPAVTLPRRRTYEELRPGAAAVLVSSFGTLEVSRREARADRRFRVRAGTTVRLRWGTRPARGKGGK